MILHAQVGAKFLQRRSGRQLRPQAHRQPQHFQDADAHQPPQQRSGFDLSQAVDRATQGLQALQQALQPLPTGFPSGECALLAPAV